jgi:hypothetical protein
MIEVIFLLCELEKHLKEISFRENLLSEKEKRIPGAKKLFLPGII